MNDNHVRYFKALYERPNIRAAAQAIPLSRQGLLKSIDALERELGVTLFENIKGDLCHPTPYGDAFYEFACDCEAAGRRLKMRFREIEDAKNNHLSLCAAIGVRGTIGTELFTSFKKSHPNVAIDCDEQPDAHCDESVHAGESMLAFTVYPYDPDFETTELYSCDRLAWVSASDPLAQRESICINDLNGYSVGLVGPSFKNYPEFSRLCQETGVQPAEIETFAEMSILYAYARNPKHLSFTAPCVVSLFDGLFANQEAPVKAIPFIGTPWRFGISYKKDHSLNSLEYEFIEHCKQYAKKLMPQN
ncbi:MAG: LysR family transcriptional regulator [Eggerthellaceae bacterium]|nr:LysR family transcriptional regulator [Eggerthellaceae bacterium]